MGIPRQIDGKPLRKSKYVVPPETTESDCLSESKDIVYVMISLWFSPSKEGVLMPNNNYWLSNLPHGVIF